MCDAGLRLLGELLLLWELLMLWGPLLLWDVLFLHPRLLTLHGCIPDHLQYRLRTICICNVEAEDINFPVLTAGKREVFVYEERLRGFAVAVLPRVVRPVILNRASLDFL